jgi:hypothetical protein
MLLLLDRAKLVHLSNREETRRRCLFNERPEREEQRKLFVDLALAFRCPSGAIDLSPTASRS